MIFKYSIGIDEVGRGPLAGPITLAAFCLPAGCKELKFDFPIKDSKQMTEDRREIVFKILKDLRKKGVINFTISHISHTSIDRYGLTKCTQLGIARCLKKLEIKSTHSKVFLDGSLYAPEEFMNQQTIVKGDEKVKVISLASIIAKVDRDKKMKKIAKKFPQYGFDTHKGYGTKAHLKAIKKHGILSIHRRSFLKKLAK